MNTKLVSRSMLMITVTLLGSLVAAVNVHPAGAKLGLVKGYGPTIGAAQPYEPSGPYIDGILVPAYLSNQDNEWDALKAGSIDVYDWAMRKSQFDEFTANICVSAPDVVAGYNPQPGDCPAGQAHIQTEIALQTVNAIDKYEIDFQNAKFPSNVQAFRWAIAWITDKENFTTNFMQGFGAPDYSAIACPVLCQTVAPYMWVDQSLLSSNACTNHVYGACLPISTRIATANAILTAAGFPISGGVRVNQRTGCAADPGGCGAALTPFFYVRTDDPERLALGRFVKNIMAGTGASGLSIQMIAGCTGNSGTYPYANNYCETTRSQLRTNVFFNFNYNMYTAGWGLARDPSYLDDLYDSNFIDPGDTNYVNYADPVFDTAARGLRAATTIGGAVAFAHAAELEYNSSLPVIEVYTHQAPYSYRIYHADSDALLNGRAWTGFQMQLGTGWHNAWSWLNMQLAGAPLHDPAHPVIAKWGWKTDVLDSPNPIDSDFVWDAQANSLGHDTIANLAADDLSFSGDIPNMGSLPTTTLVASGALFPDGSTCTPDAPATGCMILKYQLRPDLTFAAAVDGSYPAISVTPDDVRFTILIGRDSPTSFISPAYLHVQNVLTKNQNPAVAGLDSHSFWVEERNQAVWDRHDIGGTVVISVQHYCVEAHGTWAGVSGGSSLSAACNPTWPSGYPDAGVNTVGVGSSDAFGTGSPSGVVAGSYAFVLDTTVSSGSAGPLLFRTRAGTDAYFTNGKDAVTKVAPNCSGAGSCSITLSDGTVITATVDATAGGCAPSAAPCTHVTGAGVGGLPATYSNPGSVTGTKNIAGLVVLIPVSTTGAGVVTIDPLLKVASWFKFHRAGNVNWYCTSCPSGSSETGPLPAPDMVINIVDLAVVASHFCTTAGCAGTGLYGAAPWDISGGAGTPDGKSDIFDLTRVAIHFGQSFFGGTDIGGGSLGSIPTWVSETIPGT